jgi:hypothetical protein
MGVRKGAGLKIAVNPLPPPPLRLGGQEISPALREGHMLVLDVRVGHLFNLWNQHVIMNSFPSSPGGCGYNMRIALDVEPLPLLPNLTLEPEARGRRRKGAQGLTVRPLGSS